MDFFKTVKKRIATRVFRPNKTIAKKDIKKILETVNLAPSAKNLQSYKVFVVKSKKGIEGFFHSCFNQRTDFIKSASLILVFCADSKKAEEVFGKRGEKLYSLQDATIAASFAILSVTALGYSSCWVGNFKEKEVQRVLNTRLTPVASIIIGFGKEKPVRKKRKPLEIISKEV